MASSSAAEQLILIPPPRGERRPSCVSLPSATEGSRPLNLGMPELSRFLGIVIATYYRDHAPPHFHAIYGDSEVTVEIVSGHINGTFPKRALGRPSWKAKLAPSRIARRMGACSREPPASSNRAVGVVEVMTHVTDARHVSEHTLWLRFSDGAQGEIDLAGELQGEVFEPLRNIEYFRAFKLREVGVECPSAEYHL